MHKSDSEFNLEARAQLFKALGHPTRIIILNLVRIKPRHGEELAAILNLTQGTVSHHLAKLSAVGLLESRKEQYYQVYSLSSEQLGMTLAQLITTQEDGIDEAVEPDAYRRKVLNTFIRRGRIKQLPAQYKKRRILLEHLVREFEPERDYTEMEVNHILLDFNDDVATMRRELVDGTLMTRENGVYRRIDDVGSV